MQDKRANRDTPIPSRPAFLGRMVEADFLFLPFRRCCELVRTTPLRRAPCLRALSAHPPHARPSFHHRAGAAAHLPPSPMPDSCAPPP